MKKHKGYFSIRYKLALLAGVPVIGALLLSGLIVRDARREVASTAALGSVEDLALLASKISLAVHQLQTERVALSRHFGEAQSADVRLQESATDRSLLDLNTFLEKHDVRKLPPRLARDLRAARVTLAKLPEQRAAATTATGDYLRLLEFYGSANGFLISAIAALMQLSDEGELLRTISSLVSVLRFKESASQEHAVLANVFQLDDFSPGVYKELVTLVTEQTSNGHAFRENASDETQALFDRALRGDFMAKTAAMREKALNTMDEPFGVKAAEWVSLQGLKIEALRHLEESLTERVRAVAQRKVTATRANLTTSFALATAVLVTSVLLAWLIARGVTRSVASLNTAAVHVREKKDFSVRAVKISHDELGLLTETFNEMLSGIQARDKELAVYSQNLEGLVSKRTSELSARNDAMRIVLDNVEEGLATIELDGTLTTEVSSSFAKWFGAPQAGTSVWKLMAGVNPELELAFRIGWESITDDFLPWELALEQMPHRLQVRGRHYEVMYRPILRGDKMNGALLVAADVTEALERDRRAAEQQESLQVFERIMQDRSGFIEFLQEVDRLIDQTRVPEQLSTQELMRAVHTVKGNCGIFGIHSIAGVAHELESNAAEQGSAQDLAQFAPLHRAWDAFRSRIENLLGDNRGLIELRAEELEAVIASAQRRLPHEEIARQLRELSYEPVQRRFVRMADRAKSLAVRLGKGPLYVQQQAGNVRLPNEIWAPFWGAFVHVVRNAVDHGIESPAERTTAGKAEPAELLLSCRLVEGECIVEVVDNGRGIDWERVREKAKQQGLAHQTRDDLVNALFADGFSTRDEASDTSGRGIGLSAVRAACFALGGRIELTSEPGAGTTMRFCFQNARASLAPPRKVA